MCSCAFFFLRFMRFTFRHVFTSLSHPSLCNSLIFFFDMFIPMLNCNYSFSNSSLILHSLLFLLLISLLSPFASLFSFLLSVYLRLTPIPLHTLLSHTLQSSYFPFYLMLLPAPISPLLRFHYSYTSSHIITRNIITGVMAFFTT